MKKAVSYLRVSTDKQGVLGLGIEAQRATVASFCAARGYQVIEEVVEVESGRKNDRPQLARARMLARSAKATLIVAKMDRLSRDAAFLMSIKDGNDSVLFCDFPDIPDGPIGKMMVAMMACVAEYDVECIRKRTRDAMQAGKARGKKYGNPEALARYRRENPHRQPNAQAIEEAQEAAQQKIDDIAPTIQTMRINGITTCRGIATALNAKGICAPRGGEWKAESVRRVLRALPDVPTTMQ